MKAKQKASKRGKGKPKIRRMVYKHTNCGRCKDTFICPFCYGEGCANCGNTGACPFCYDPGGHA